MTHKASKLERTSSYADFDHRGMAQETNRINYGDGSDEEEEEEQPLADSDNDEANDAFGGLPEACSAYSGATLMPDGLNENVKLETFSLGKMDRLFQEIKGMADEGDHLDSMSRKRFYQTLPLLKKATDMANKLVRKDRQEARISRGDKNSILVQKPSVGQFIFASTPQSLGNRRLSVLDESRISTTSGDFSVKVRPQMIIAVMSDSYLTVVGGSRNGRDIDADYVERFPSVARTYIRVCDAAKPLRKVNGVRDPVRVVRGEFLRATAVLDGTWLNVVRKGEVAAVRGGRIDPESVENLVEFLHGCAVQPLRSFLQTFDIGLDMFEGLVKDPDLSPQSQIIDSLRNLEAQRDNELQMAQYKDQRSLSIPKKRSYDEGDTTGGARSRETKRGRGEQHGKTGVAGTSIRREVYGHQGSVDRASRSAASPPNGIHEGMAGAYNKPKRDRASGQGKLQSSGMTADFAALRTTGTRTEAGAGRTNEPIELFPHLLNRRSPGSRR